MAAADSSKADTEVLLDMPPYGRLYKSGRVEPYTRPKGGEVPTDLVYEDVVIDSNVRVRLIMPKALLVEESREKVPVLINFHGGGFFIPFDVVGPFERSFYTDVVEKANVLMVNVDYRYVDRPDPPTPDGRLPAPYDDSEVALRWVFSTDQAHRWLAEHGDFQHVFIMGDSAGANIASHLTLQVGSGEVAGLPQGAKIEGVALLCPYFWGATPIPDEPGSPNFNSWLHQIARSVLDLQWWRVMNTSEINSLEDPRINPVGEAGAQRLARLGCERAFFCVAGVDDPWQWRSKLYFQKLMMESSWPGSSVQMYWAPTKGHVFFFDDLDSYDVGLFVASLAAFFSCGRRTSA